MSQYHVEITDRQSSYAADPHYLRQAICQVLAAEAVASASISLVLVDDDQIHQINRQYLGHDYPTDVISFLLDQSVVDSDTTPDGEKCSEPDGRLDAADAVDRQPPQSGVRLEGELIVSTQTAVRAAAEHGWSPAAELLLYVVHGLLHLCGYDDVADNARPIMRSRERELMAMWGFCPIGLES